MNDHDLWRWFDEAFDDDQKDRLLDLLIAWWHGKSGVVWTSERGHAGSEDG